MLMVLEIAPEMNGWAAAIMRMWLSTDRKRLPFLPAAVGAVEDLQVLGLQVRRPFEGHRAAHMVVGRFDVGLGEAHAREHVEVKVVQLRIGEAQRIAAERFAQVQLVEHELDVKGRAQRFFDLV